MEKFEKEIDDFSRLKIKMTFIFLTVNKYWRLNQVK
jgi:hypothetical protein